MEDKNENNNIEEIIEITENIEIIETKESEENIIVENLEQKDSFFDKVKNKTEKQIESYKIYTENESNQEEFSKTQANKFSNLISWDLLKMLVYIFIGSFLINDIQNFLFSAIVILFLIKLDILEPIFRFIRALFKK